VLINGECWEASDGGTFDVPDTATWKVLATLASATIDEAVAALDAADAAQASWAAQLPVGGSLTVHALVTGGPPLTAVLKFRGVIVALNH